MIKSAPTEVASTRGMKTRLAAGAAAGSSFFREDGTGVDVPTTGAFSTAGASQTPKDDDDGNEDDDDEDPPLDETTTTAILRGRASEECSTLQTQRLWINFFFTILAMAR
jgi:hypothetical protein